MHFHLPLFQTLGIYQFLHQYKAEGFVVPQRSRFLNGISGTLNDDSQRNEAVASLSVSSDSIQYIGKTIESFKLADVYWLESCISAYTKNSIETPNALELVDRLALHRPTSSYLLGYTVKGDCDATIDNTIHSRLPFRTCRFQYVAKVVAAGDTPHNFLAAVKETLASQEITHPYWLLSYDTFAPLNPRVPSTMLMCAVSRLLPGEPLLEGEIDARSDVLTYLILETSNQLYLVKKIAQQQKKASIEIVQHFREAWSQRPFQYSGAINIDIAVTTIDILSDILQIGGASREDSDASKTIRILDPTCGSGTFLALAAMTWGNFTNIQLTGVDSNPKCAQGTVLNLMKMLSAGGSSMHHRNDKDITFELRTNNLALSTTATIIAGDSTLVRPKALGELFDCAVTNLPWNRNTFEFKGRHDVGPSQSMNVNRDILQAVSLVLRPGGPIVVITANSNGDSSESGCGQEVFDAQTCLMGLGFTILGSASVPPRGYILPSSKKKGKTTLSKKSKGSSNCSIIVALAHKQHNRNDTGCWG